MFLFHGSAYEQKELMPGFQRSGELVQWDISESNEYLYATTSSETAIGLGFASAIEKKYNLDRFRIEGDAIFISLSGKYELSLKELKQLDVYLYTIELSTKDRWIKNDNKHNNLTTEYKTKSTIKDNLKKVVKVDLDKWLSTKKITINGKKPLYSRW